MAQQRKLFSFFNKSPGPPSKDDLQSSTANGSQRNQISSIEINQQRPLKLSGKSSPELSQEEGNARHGWQHAGHISDSPETPQPRELLWKKFKAPLLDTQGAPSRPLVPRIKRIQDTEAADGEVCDPITDSTKRRKLMDALGVQEGPTQGGKWAAAQAKFDWLLPNKTKDAKGRSPDHPLYDKRTLFIPEDALSKMTASQKQYWTLKSEYMDTVLFFKVGKFYELYEIDAEIGHKEMDWKLTLSGVGKCRQVGVPESGIDVAVQKLVARGYKVGRMEQLETSDQAKKRGGGMVRRDLTQVVTPSTRLDGNLRPEAVHLLALREEPLDAPHHGAQSQGSVAIGYAFVDAAAGKFYVGSIHDDCSRSALGALLTQVAPQEVLFELGGITVLSNMNSVFMRKFLKCPNLRNGVAALSDDTSKVLRHHHRPGLLPMMATPLTDEYLEPHQVIKMIKERDYFRVENDLEDSKGLWPEALEVISDKHLAASALGALVSHLLRIKVAAELLPYGVLLPYEVYRGSLQLDGQTVANLELLENRDGGGRAGTLLGYLDGCATKYGKRLLRRWICHPLQNVAELNDRLDAVEELMKRTEMACSIREDLRVLPDLERLVARVRGLAGSPNLGVIPMAAKKVHERRLKTFCEAVQGMRAAFELLTGLRSCKDRAGPPTARLLEAAMVLGDTNSALVDALEVIEGHIDRTNKALRLHTQTQEGAPDSGDFEDNDDVTSLEKEAKSLTRLMVCFNKHSETFQAGVETLARLDVLISFAASAHTAAGPTCRPEFVSNDNSGRGGSVLEIKGLWHPLGIGGQGGAIVPNDLELGTPNESPCVQPRTMLLTGPNMGGKSTLLRATCLAVIMAQLGCFVPGEACTLSPVDIVFTRLGASDRIMEGHSTFMVECTEAASVLRYATNNSLVVLDELGRGTSTFDGYAIAYSVLRHVVDTLDCRLLFATHYHALTTEFASHPSVGLRHMACALLESRNKTTDSISDRDLVFLYKLKEGVCQQSYGLQVATLAGLPRSIVHAAERASKAMEIKISGAFDAALLKEGLPHLHKQWFSALLEAVNFDDEDLLDTLYCIWQEMQRSAV